MHGLFVCSFVNVFRLAFLYWYLIGAFCLIDLIHLKHAEGLLPLKITTFLLQVNTRFFIHVLSSANIFSSLLSLLLVVTAYARESSKGDKRQQLGFRPVHFAAVGLPLRDTSPNGNSEKTGAFKIDDGNVVGMC